MGAGFSLLHYHSQGLTFIICALFLHKLSFYQVIGLKSKGQTPPSGDTKISVNLKPRLSLDTRRSVGKERTYYMVGIIIMRNWGCCYTTGTGRSMSGTRGFTEASPDASVPRRMVNRKLQQPRTSKSKAIKGSDFSGI